MVTSGLISFLNPGFRFRFDRDRREIRQVVFAGTVACRFITDIRVIAARRYFGHRRWSLWRIGDAALKARVRGLRAKNGRERNKDQEGEGGTRIISPQGNAEAVSVLSAC